MSTYSKSGTVNSPDFVHTGGEIVWHNWQSWDLEKFYSTRAKAIRFYAYYLNEKELMDLTLKWMKKEKYSAADITTIKNSESGALPAMVGKLIRCMDRGMPPSHPNAQEYYNNLPFHDTPPIAKSDYDVVKDEIRKVLKLQFEIIPDNIGSVPEKISKVISPLDRIRENVRKDIIMVLEELIDKWAYPKNGIANINLGDLLKIHKVPTQGCKQIIDWLEYHRIGYNDALEKLCPQAVEGYSFLSKVNLKNIVKGFDTMLADVRLHAKIKVAERKPRTKKSKSADKQVVKLKYQLNSSEYSLDSIAPSRIPGSQRIYIFNTKSRLLSVLFAKGTPGFSVKGSAVLDWNPDESFAMVLRKPGDILAGILSAPPKKLDKIFDGVKTTRKPVTGRVNGDCILLKVIETRI